MRKGTWATRLLLPAMLLAVTACSRPPSWDFLQRLSEPGKIWNLDCAEEQRPPFTKDAKARFFYDSDSLSLKIDGKDVKLENAVRAGMKRLRKTPDELACLHPHPATDRTPKTASTQSAAPPPASCEIALGRIDAALPALEHVSATYREGFEAKCAYFFLLVPDDGDLRRDELLIKTTTDDGGVGENSVHGGPPN